MSTGFRQYYTEEGSPYYFEASTGRSMWASPTDWVAQHDAAGNMGFINTVTGDFVWGPDTFTPAPPPIEQIAPQLQYHPGVMQSYYEPMVAPRTPLMAEARRQQFSGGVAFSTPSLSSPIHPAYVHSQAHYSPEAMYADVDPYTHSGEAAGYYFEDRRGEGRRGEERDTWDEPSERYGIQRAHSDISSSEMSRRDRRRRAERTIHDTRSRNAAPNTWRGESHPGNGRYTRSVSPIDGRYGGKGAYVESPASYAAFHRRHDLSIASGISPYPSDTDYNSALDSDGEGIASWVLNKMSVMELLGCSREPVLPVKRSEIHSATASLPAAGTAELASPITDVEGLSAHLAGLDDSNADTVARHFVGLTFEERTAWLRKILGKFGESVYSKTQYLSLYLTAQSVPYVSKFIRAAMVGSAESWKVVRTVVDKAMTTLSPKTELPQHAARRRRSGTPKRKYQTPSLDESDADAYMSAVSPPDSSLSYHGDEGKAGGNGRGSLADKLFSPEAVASMVLASPVATTSQWQSYDGMVIAREGDTNYKVPPQPSYDIEARPRRGGTGRKEGATPNIPRHYAATPSVGIKHDTTPYIPRHYAATPSLGASAPSVSTFTSLPVQNTFAKEFSDVPLNSPERIHREPIREHIPVAEDVIAASYSGIDTPAIASLIVDRTPWFLAPGHGERYSPHTFTSVPSEFQVQGLDASLLHDQVDPMAALEATAHLERQRTPPPAAPSPLSAGPITHIFNDSKFDASSLNHSIAMSESQPVPRQLFLDASTACMESASTEAALRFMKPAADEQVTEAGSTQGSEGGRELPSADQSESTTPPFELGALRFPPTEGVGFTHTTQPVQSKGVQ